MTEGRARRAFLLRGVSAAVALLGVSACANLFGPRMLLREHPLVERIWDVQARRFVDSATLAAALGGVLVVLLGESHDNPDHHRIQKELIEAIGTETAPRALAMEQFDAEQQTAIDAALRDGNRDADGIAMVGRLDRTGWKWPHYRPLVATALARGMPIVAANLSRPLARRIVTSGIAVLGERGQRLPLETTWSEGRERIMTDLIHAGHCGEAPENIVRGIVLAQRARDATMAQAIVPHLRRGVIGIVGRGHARRDVGVPLYLDALAPGATVRVVGLVEVEEGKADAAAYALEGESTPYDYIWFTARAARADPCAGLRREKLPGAAGQ